MDGGRRGLTGRPRSVIMPAVLCPKCDGENSPDAHRCIHCGASLSVALLEVVRGNLPEKIYFLKPRSYTLGRARHNDLSLTEPSISKAHARILYEDGRFTVEDQGSLHGVYVNASKVQRTALPHGAQIQLGNVTLKFSLLGSDGSTEQIAEFPWIEQQQLLLSLVQTLNSTLVLSQVLEQVLDAVMRITKAERGFLLLTPEDAEPEEGFPFRYALAPALPLRQGQESGGHGVAEAAAAEMHAYPHVTALVGEDVHVVVAAPHGAELVAGLGAQAVALVPPGHCLPARIVEEGMVGGRVVRAVGAAHAEGDGVLDLVGQAFELGAGELLEAAIGADRRVAACDVEPHAHDAHLVAIGGHAADRHHVPQVPVRHERDALGPGGDVAQLGEGFLFVGAENGGLSHAVASRGARKPAASSAA